MATLQSRLTDLVTAIATDVKGLLTTRGTLSSLTTTEKTSLVGAINELQAEINAVGASVTINDAATNGATTVVWSADKVYDELQALKTSILGGAGAAYDTLIELQNLLQGQDTSLANLLTSVGNRVRFDAAQSLTTPQQAQARANIAALSTIELGDPDTNLVTLYTAAKA